MKKPIKHQKTVKDRSWEISYHSNPKLNQPILIEGMPGIGNVGKIAMDMLIEETKAELLVSFFSHSLPISVFVNEDNLVELPKIAIYHKKIAGKDILFMTGDAQPVTEQATYELCEIIITYIKSFNGSQIITIGGIGLAQIPDKPKVYLTGTDKDNVKKFSSKLNKLALKHENEIYGVVGPILGVSGVMLGMAKKYNTQAVSLLAETFGHPVYIGLKGTKAILNILNKTYNLNLKLEKLDKEIRQVDAQEKGLDVTDKKSGKLLRYKKFSETSYIG